MKNKLNEQDEHSDFKVILNKWAEDESNGKIKNFGKKIEIIDVDDGKVIKYDYRTRYVKRKFEDNCVMSFDGEDIPESVSTPVGLWDYNTKGDNQNGTDDKIITEAEYEEEYRQLQEEIEVAKKNNDIIKLYELNKNVEKYNTYETFLESKFEDNRSCYPLKETFKLSICPRCAGEGKVSCIRCNGSGKILEYGKRIHCPSCEGAKNVICHICHGKKKVVKYTALYEYFTYEDETQFIKSDNLPEAFSIGVESLDRYFTISNDVLVINQSNIDAIFEHFDDVQKNLSTDKTKPHGLFAELIKSHMTSKSENLDFDTRINQLIIKTSNFDFKIIKYKYNKQEYKALVYGKDNKVYAPLDAYPQYIKNKKNKEFSKNELGNPPKKRFKSLFLCLFFGFFGIHRFYVGKVKSGLLQLLISIISIVLISSNEENSQGIFLFICLIWYLIDLFSILFGKFKDKEKKYIKKWV